MAFHSLCIVKNVEPSLPLFYCFFQLNKCFKRAGTFLIQKSQSIDSPFIDDLHKPPIGFKRRWLIVFPPQSQWDAPLQFCWGRLNTPKLQLSQLRESLSSQMINLLSGDHLRCSELLSAQNLSKAGWRVITQPNNPLPPSSRNVIDLNNDPSSIPITELSSESVQSDFQSSSESSYKSSESSSNATSKYSESSSDSEYSKSSSDATSKYSESYSKGVFNILFRFPCSSS